MEFNSGFKGLIYIVHLVGYFHNYEISVCSVRLYVCMLH